MKKWINGAYLLSGILIGVVFATSGSAFAAQVKSLVGQKVTSELTVIVNGKELPNKAPVINGVTNAPVRAISDALGADLELEGKVINITTSEGQVTPAIDKADQLTSLNNERNKISKKVSGLQESVKMYEEKIIPNTEYQIQSSNAQSSKDFYSEKLEQDKQEYEEVKSNLADLQKQLEEIDAKIAELEK